MQIYFIPFACSLAARIAAEEAGLDARFVLVRPGQPLPDGGDYAAISPLGYVPALRLEDGRVLTEGPAVLQYLAGLAPEGVLAPAEGTFERRQLQMWLNLISTEVHKAIFAPLLNRRATDGAREWARSLIPSRFAMISGHLEGREHLLDAFSVADAYLLAVLNWCEFAGVDLAAWPVLHGWRERMRGRPSVARAMAAEMPLRNAA